MGLREPSVVTVGRLRRLLDGFLADDLVGVNWEGDLYVLDSLGESTGRWTGMGAGELKKDTEEVRDAS